MTSQDAANWINIYNCVYHAYLYKYIITLCDQIWLLTSTCVYRWQVLMALVNNTTTYTIMPLYYLLLKITFKDPFSCLASWSTYVTLSSSYVRICTYIVTHETLCQTGDLLIVMLKWCNKQSHTLSSWNVHTLWKAIWRKLNDQNDQHCAVDKL